MEPPEPRLKSRPASDSAALLREFQADVVELETRAAPRSAVWLLWTMVALVLVALAWSYVANIDRVVVAPGRIVTTAQRIVVQALATSRIEEIAVQIGQVVRKGEVLVRLDPTYARADLAQASDRASSFSAQLDRLSAESAQRNYQAKSGAEQRLQDGIYRERRAQYASTLNAHDSEIARLEAATKTNVEQSAGLRENLRILRELEDMRGRLAASQFAAKADLLEAQRRRVETETELRRMENQNAELVHQLGKARAERATFVRDWQRKIGEELVTVKRDHDATTEQLNKARQQHALIELRAPVDAVVLELAQRSAGSVAKEADPIVTLVPLDAPLEAEVEIRAADIGFVRAEQSARIKLDAFPFQKHGTLKGRVRVVTEDAFAKDDRGSTTLTYRARIVFESRELRRVPDRFRLIPGMSLAAEIRIGERTVLEYLLYPLWQAFDEGLREP